MSGIRDTATVTLNVNGTQAKQMMSELEQKVSDTKKKISDLKAAMADPKDIEKARKELKSYEKQLDEVRSATQGVESALGNLDSATPRQLEKALRTLNRQLKDMTPGSETWNSHIEKIKELKSRLAELKGEMNEQKSIWGKFKDWALGAWPALDLLGQWGSGFIDLARTAVDAFATMDQEMANVRKFTGMTAEQVDELNEEFKKMDTRTSREELNKLAQEAGRLGKTKPEDVMGFVRAADKINVALDDLGEGATLTLSKLTGIFGDEKIYGTEQSLLKVGSVINELSQNCSASAPYLAEFASRMGGVGAQAGMTIQQIMGFAAVLDSNGQKVEASSTALSQVIVRMMQEPAKYARVAGLDVQKFTSMLKEDTNSALLMFLETLQKAGNMDVLSPMFKDMGENGSRAIAALSTLATHIGEVKAQQEAANVAFKEGTSVDKEFEVQNNTVQAGLDKCRKAAQDIRVELGERLAPLMSHMLSSTSAIMRALLTTVNFLIDNKTAVIALTAAIAAYNVVIAKEIVVKRLRSALDTAHYAYLVITEKATKSLAVVTEGIRLVYYKYTGQVSKAMVAQKAFNAAMTATPWSAIIAAIVAAGAALLIFRNRTNEAAEAQKALNEVKSEAAKRLADEKTKIELLVQAARNEKLSLEERHKAIAALNKIIPNYNGQLDVTTRKYRENKVALDEYLKSLVKKYEIEGARAKLAELGKEKAEVTVKQREAQEAYDRNQREMANANYLNGQYTTSFGLVGNSYSKASDHFKKKLDEANSKLDIIKAKESAILKVYNLDLQKQEADSANEGGTDFGSGSGFSGTGYTSQVQAEKDAKKAQAAARAAAVKAKKEFKEQLDQIKAARDKEQAEIIALRMAGEINYVEYNKRKLEADQKYYDDAIALYEKWGIQEDDECQSLVRKREEFLNKANEKRLALNKEVIQRIALAEERELRARYNSRSSHTLAEEMQFEEELLKIRYNALQDQQSLYDATSKEYEDYQRQIDDLFIKDQEEKQKKLLAKIDELRKKYEYQPIKVKYDMERAAVEELYRLKKIKEEEYREWLKKINEQEAEETKKEKDELPGMQTPDNPKNRTKAARKKYEDQKQELDEALANGIINESEYQTALQRIENDLRKSLISPLQECKSEWVSLLFTMAESWAEFADALKDPDGDPLGALATAIQSTAAIATSVMSMVTEFQKAELEIQTAAINKRYDAEIEAAEGNSYKVAKLEKQKEKELAKAKNEANRKMFAMQVIQAVAQTAQNALNAYGSAVAIPVVGHVLAPIAAAMAVADGAIQIAIIKKQQQASEAQGYSKGGFTKPGAVDEPAGIVHAGEWVASQRLLANPVARPMIEALDYAQRTNTIGSLKDEDVSRSIRATDSMVRMAESDGSAALMVAAVARNAQVVDALNERLHQPLGAIVTVAGDYGINNAKEEYNQYLKNKNPKSKK